MRSEFEKLPIIQEIIADEYDGLMFDERFSKYLCPSDGNEEYLNGAWMAWKEQQSKVDELQKRVDAAIYLLPSIKAENDLCGCDQVERQIELLEQALKGGSTPNLNTDENGECRHFSTTLFQDSKAECFHCDAVVNEQREVIGKQSKGLHPFFKKELP